LYDTKLNFISAIEPALHIARDLLKIESITQCSVFTPPREGIYHRKDKLLERRGLTKELPFIRNTNASNYPDTSTGYGCTLHKTSTGLKYVVIAYESNGGDDYQTVVCDRKITFKLRMFFRRRVEAEKKLTMNSKPLLDAKLMEEVILNTIGFLDNAKRYSAYGVKVVRGCVFRGDPGNGKSMMGKYLDSLAKHKGYTSQVVTSADIERNAKQNTLPQLMSCANIIRFDDVDLTFLTRNKELRSNNSQMACSLLGAMDGIVNDPDEDAVDGVVRIFTTNEETIEIDPAFLRPGRIDKVFHFTRPSAALRNEFVTMYWKPIITSNIDVKSLVNRTEDLSFAELDEIKTLLVQNYIQTNKWDLDKAISDFQTRS